MMAGCLIAAPIPTSTAPSSHQPLKRPLTGSRVTHNPATTRPIISESLCAPPMKSITSTGLSVPNHAAKAGSAPRIRAIRGISKPIRPTPITARARIATAEA